MDTFIHISENILHYLVEAGVIILELFGVAILLYTSISCFIRWLRKDEAVSLRLGQGIALGLEFKLGGEVLRTVITREKDELIILFSGGILARYSWADGTMIDSSKLLHYRTENFNDTVNWYFEENYLYLISRGYYPLFHIINLDTWEEEVCLQGVLAFDEIRDRIICYSFDKEGRYVGYFPHYSVEDLLQKAREALHGAELTDAERDNYGLR